MDYYTYSGNIVVTTPSSDLRKLSRDALAGRWKIAAIGTMIFMAVVTIPSAILTAMMADSFAADLYSILVSGAFTMGYSVFILNLFRGKEADYSQLFCGFERIAKTMGLYLYICLFVFLWSLLFVVPGIFAALRYSQSFFILADHPDMPVSEIVNESKRMMRGNKAKYFCLGLSFFGWFLLASIPASVFGSIVGVVYSSELIVEAGNAAMIGTQLLTGVRGLWFQIASFLLGAGYFWITPYVECSLAAMYEIMNGNLRPGIIDVAGEVTETADNAVLTEDTEDTNHITE